MHLDPTTLILSGQFVCFVRHRGYAASSDGRIWTCRSSGPGNRDRFTKPWRALKPGMTSMGYVTVGIGLGGGKNQRSRYVHELVLEAFMGPRPLGMECCHNNGDKTDNRLENLRWDTRSENSNDSFRDGTRPTNENHHWTKLDNESVEEAIGLVNNGVSQSEVARQFNVHPSTISRYVNAKRRRWL
jgi:hypothetical protein